MHFGQLRVLVLVVFALLIGVSLVGITRLRFDFSFEAFLPEDDPELTFYLGHQERFGHGFPSANLALPHNPSIFQHDFLSRADSLGKAVRRLPYVREVSSLLTLKDIIYHPVMPAIERVLDFRGKHDFGEDSARIMADPRMVGNFVSQDGKMLMLSISLKKPFPDSLEGAMIDTVNALCTRFGFQETHLVGAPVTHHVLVGLQESQFVLYVGLASAVMILVLVAVFRRIWGVLVAVIAIFSSMILFFGGLGWLGKPLDLMATMYPIMLVVVGVSDAVHVITKYVDERLRGQEAIPAIKTTIKEIGLATWLTCLTTSVGLFSLMTSPMPPIRDFGLYAGCGVIVTFIGVMLIVPALMVSLGPNQLMHQTQERPLFAGWIRSIISITSRKPKRVLIVAGVVLVISAIGSTKVSSNITAARDLPWRSDLLHDYLAVDHAFGGLSSADISFQSTGDSGFRNPARIFEMQKAGDYVANQANVSQVHSVVTYYKLANRFMNGNAPEAFRLPADSIPLQTLNPVIDKQLADAMGYVVSKDRQWSMLYARIPDLGSHYVAAVRDSFDSWASAHLDTSLVKARHTGPRYLYDVNQVAIAEGMMASLLLSVLTAALFFAVTFRNVRIVLGSIIPNIFPLVITVGIIGFLGIELDPKVAMVFSIAYGIAVDDTIHFLSRYMLERRKGHSVEASINGTLWETGKAMIITTMVLFFAFGSLLFSPFPPTFMIGFLLSLTLGIALFADLYLNPILMRWLKV